MNCPRCGTFQPLRHVVEIVDTRAGLVAVTSASDPPRSRICDGHSCNWRYLVVGAHYLEGAA